MSYVYTPVNEPLQGNGFTLEELEALHGGAGGLSYVCIQRLIESLIIEMKAPKVWDGSPEYAGVAQVTFSKSIKEPQTIWSRAYTREPPKSTARQVAEEAGNESASKHGWNDVARKIMIDSIEKAILKYEERVK